MKHLKQFVENVISAKKLIASDQAKSQVIKALRIAGLNNAPFSEKEERRATKLVEKVLFPAKKEHTKALSGGRVTTAAVVTAGQDCPRCGHKLIPIAIGANGENGYYCTNSRCRVTCYRGD